MTGWLDRVDQLLYDGEEIRDRVDVGAGGIVVTTHRVLAFTPDGEGTNFRDVDRPNVTGVSETTSGTTRYLQWAVKPIVVGVVLIGAGQTVSLDSLVGSVEIGAGTARVGLGGMLGMLQTFLSLMARLDELMTMAGALALLVGTLALGVYALSRSRSLVVSVAGDGEDIRLPAPEDADEIARHLEAVILPEDQSPAAPTDAPGA